MTAVTVRNLSDETHRALKRQAAEHGRSTEAEIRAILDAAVRPQSRIQIGSALAQIGRNAGLTSSDIEMLEEGRDREPAQPMRFE
jgi:plasmid stability protein